MVTGSVAVVLGEDWLVGALYIESPAAKPVPSSTRKRIRVRSKEFPLDSSGLFRRLLLLRLVLLVAAFVIATRTRFISRRPQLTQRPLRVLLQQVVAVTRAARMATTKSDR